VLIDGQGICPSSRAAPVGSGFGVRAVVSMSSRGALVTLALSIVT